MDGGALWAAVHRVAQSWTRLKQLSMHACLEEGNGNPLQCSCLENPRDGGAWWAAVCGVAQSRTQLKQLSSSSSILFCIVAAPIYISTNSDWNCSHQQVLFVDFFIMAVLTCEVVPHCGFDLC